MVAFEDKFFVIVNPKAEESTSEDSSDEEKEATDSPNTNESGIKAGD